MLLKETLLHNSKVLFLLDPNNRWDLQGEEATSRTLHKPQTRTSSWFICFMRCPIGHQGYTQLIRLTNKLITLPPGSVCFQTTKCVLLSFVSDIHCCAKYTKWHYVLIKAPNLRKDRDKFGYCRTHPFCSYHSFKMCVNLRRACATVKIASHVPVIPNSSRNMKTKKFMRVTCVLVRIQKKLLIRKNKTTISGAAALIFCAFLALWETACIITVTYHTIERLY